MGIGTHFRLNKGGIALIAVLGVLGAGRFVYHAIEASFACKRTVLARVASPDGRLAAVTEEVSCGAGAPVVTEVSLVPAGAAPDPDRYPPFFRVRDRHDLRVRWAGDAALAVDAPGGVRADRMEHLVDGVAIVYD